MNIPVKSNAERNVATSRLMIINQKRISFGVALAPSSPFIVGVSSPMFSPPSRSLCAVVSNIADLSCVLDDMALVSVMDETGGSEATEK